MPTTFIFFIAVSLICHWAGGDFSKKSKNYGDVPQGLEPTIYQPTPRTVRLGSSPRIERSFMSSSKFVNRVPRIRLNKWKILNSKQTTEEHYTK